MSNAVAPIHPFPARMAPEIALAQCERMQKGWTILDPMCGSGTTLRVAIENGLNAYGSDLDPLAVLIADVFTTRLVPGTLELAIESVVARARTLRSSEIELPWIDKETSNFIEFWFAPKQIDALRRVVFVIDNGNYPPAIQRALKVAVSRLIITKEKAASLARDTAHSRPHRVATSNDFDVYDGLARAARFMGRRLPLVNSGTAMVRTADARKLDYVQDSSIDAVITSPPYLNAIDYMRGSKLSLVWLGYTIGELRQVRSSSIGAERKLESEALEEILLCKIEQLPFYGELGLRDRGMFNRYAVDMLSLAREIERVLRREGLAVLVVGNSNLHGVFIENTQAVMAAAEMCGLKLVDYSERELPANRRYLPIPLQNDAALGKRMRTEAILTFSKT